MGCDLQIAVQRIPFYMSHREYRIKRVTTNQNSNIYAWPCGLLRFTHSLFILLVFHAYVLYTLPMSTINSSVSRIISNDFHRSKVEC